MRFQKEFARQCVSARTRSTEEHKVKMESIVHFYRNNEILFDRIREQAIQQRKTAEELERQKANVTSDRDDLIKKLQMSNVDVKKQRLRRAMHGRRVQENNDEEQCRLQRLADLYFEQLANERQLSVRAHQLTKQHTALKKRTHDIANRLSKVGSPVQKKVPKPTAKPKSPKDERVPSVKFDAARDALEAARSNTRHLSERIEAVRSDMHAADQERQALTARRIGQAASALREFTRNENVDLVRTFCQNFLHTGLTLCQGLERQLQCRSCRQRMVDPVMTLGCLHVQCRKCLSACRAASQCSNCNSLRPSNRFISSPGLDAALTALCALEKRLRSLQACTADLDDAVNPKRFGIPGTNK
ncbi:hypothetical protein PBRA_002199 [Plasmodiophora brassicae]|nr:hypothetical protein PBRA_002199 [Plasmodiophora brassicae]